MVKYFTAYIIWNKAQTTLFHNQQHKGIVQDVSETCIYTLCMQLYTDSVIKIASGETRSEKWRDCKPTPGKPE